MLLCVAVSDEKEKRKALQNKEIVTGSGADPAVLTTGRMLL